MANYLEQLIFTGRITATSNRQNEDFKTDPRKTAYITVSSETQRKKLIDFVASDNHCNKERNYYTFKKAYKKIKRRYNKEYVNDIFYNNPKMILNSVK